MLAICSADVLGKDSVERMGKALSIVQEALAKMAVRGICAEQKCVLCMPIVVKNIIV